MYILTQPRRFFRRHCEYTISKRKRNRTREVLRSKSSFMKNISISAPIGVFKQREPALRQDKRPEDPVTPQFQFQVPTPGVTRANTSTVYGRENAERDEPITDTRTFSSSPRSANVPLPDGSPRSPSMVLSPDSEKPFSPNANSFKAVEFAPSATMSPRLLQHPTLSIRRKSPFIFDPSQLTPNPTADNRPYMRRRGTMLSSAPPTIPGSPTSPTSRHSNKYQGMGGFPGPAHLLHTVVRITAPHAYAHVERKLNRTMTMPTVTTIESANVPWLKNLNKLVVGRNSDFRTEGLSDEELEDIGGAEYRALRLLSYFVPAVSPYLVFFRNSSI